MCQSLVVKVPSTLATIKSQKLIMLHLIVTLYLVSSTVPVSGQKANNDWTFSDFIPETYDKTQSPLPFDYQPLNVTIEAKVTQLLAVNEAEQSYTVDILFTQKWPDHRLKFPPLSHVMIPLDISWKNRLWIPDVYITNAISPSMVQLAPLFLEIEANTSRLILTTRQVVKLRCHMDLFRFPQDMQVCSIEFTLLTTPKERAVLEMKEFTLSSQKKFPNFYVVKEITGGECSSIRGHGYSCIASQLKLFRNVSYYIIRIYGPSLLLVVTAFVGFWIPPCGYPARVALIVTPLLSLITQQTQINSEINVSYVVALHIWMIFCTFFVFMALIEYALAIVYCHVVDEKKDLAAHDPIGFSYAYASTRISNWIKRVLIKIYGDVDFKKNPLDRNKVDYCARIIFPLLYLVFIVIYILVFLVPWIAAKYHYEL